MFASSSHGGETSSLLDRLSGDASSSLRTTRWRLLRRCSIAKVNGPRFRPVTWSSRRSKTVLALVPMSLTQKSKSKRSARSTGIQLAQRGSAFESEVMHQSNLLQVAKQQVLRDIDEHRFLPLAAGAARRVPQQVRPRQMGPARIVVGTHRVTAGNVCGSKGSNVSAIWHVASRRSNRPRGPKYTLPRGPWLHPARTSMSLVAGSAL